MEKSAILYLWKTNDRICYQQCSSKLFSIKLYLPPASQPARDQRTSSSQWSERADQSEVAGWLVDLQVGSGLLGIKICLIYLIEKNKKTEKLNRWTGEVSKKKTK